MAPSESIALNLSQCHHCDKAIGQLDTCSSLAHSSLAFGRIISIPRQRSFQWPSPVLPYLGSQSTITGLPLTNETFWRLFPYWQDIVFSFSRSQLSSLQHSVTPRLKLEKIIQWKVTLINVIIFDVPIILLFSSVFLIDGSDLYRFHSLWDHETVLYSSLSA